MEKIIKGLFGLSAILLLVLIMGATQTVTADPINQENTLEPNQYEFVRFEINVSDSFTFELTCNTTVNLIFVDANNFGLFLDNQNYTSFTTLLGISDSRKIGMLNILI